jgi:hypothetical protein
MRLNNDANKTVISDHKKPTIQGIKYGLCELLSPLISDTKNPATDAAATP